MTQEVSQLSDKEKEVLSRVYFPELYEMNRFAYNKKDFVVLVGPNHIIIEQNKEDSIRNIFKEQKISYLLSGERRVGCRHSLSYFVRDPEDSESDLEKIRNLSLTVPESTLPNHKNITENNIFEKFERRNQTLVEDTNCYRSGISENVRAEWKRLAEKKRHWQKLFNGEFKPRKHQPKK